MADFYTTVTDVGTEKIAAAIINNEKLSIVKMAVGDGGGALPIPSPSQQKLIGEKYRGNVNTVFIDSKNPNQIIAELIINENIGGFWIREAGLFDKDDNLIAVANCPETFKPVLSQGSGRNSIVRMVLIVSEVAAVELKTDPTTVIATRSYVDSEIITLGKKTERELEEHVESRNHPDATLTEKGFTKLSNSLASDSQTVAATPKAIKDAIAAAVKQAWELTNPKGICLYFFENVNPNTLWPWSKWEYTGEGRTVRIAKQDGSNVGQTGGSDTVIIQRANLPAEKLGIAGFTSSIDFGVMRTQKSGKHKHGGVPARTSEYELGGVNRVLFDPNKQGETDEAPDHDHTFTIPAHNHTIEGGETDTLGQGQEISIVESHVLQMCWRRVA